MTSHRQTISYLTRRFREVGIRPDTRHGQNFLIDLNLLQVLVDRAALEPQDVVLEVGTGTGSLTAVMAPQVAAVVTVEVDRRMFQLASEELIEQPNVVMLQQDALRNKNNLDERVLDEVRRQLEAGPGRCFKLVANLPYNIATPVLSNLLSTPLVPKSMTVTIQKELAERIVASPGTKDYSALSVWIQSQCRVELVRTLSPTVFWPRPKVTSAFVHIEPDETLRARIADLPFFHVFVRSLFLHRRKFLRSGLVAALKDRLTKPQVDQVMQQLNLGPNSRAEEVPVERMIELCDAVRGALAAAGENR
jgi:16S rRNA (adenine1518-N6/adenine1519-N6)-dimethyltransferase